MLEPATQQQRGSSTSSIHWTSSGICRGFILTCGLVHLLVVLLLGRIVVGPPRHAAYIPPGVNLVADAGVVFIHDPWISTRMEVDHLCHAVSRRALIGVIIIAYGLEVLFNCFESFSRVYF